MNSIYTNEKKIKVLCDYVSRPLYEDIQPLCEPYKQRRYITKFEFGRPAKTAKVRFSIKSASNMRFCLQILFPPILLSLQARLFMDMGRLCQCR